MSNNKVAVVQINEFLLDNLLDTKNRLVSLIGNRTTDRNTATQAISMVDSINVILDKNALSESTINMLDECQSMFKIILGTGNANKLSELQNYFMFNEVGSIINGLFAPYSTDFTGNPEPEEGKLSFAVNAKIKSEHYSSRTLISGIKKCIILSDDSGMMVHYIAEVVQAITDELDIDSSDAEINAMQKKHQESLENYIGSNKQIVPFIPGVVSARFASNDVLKPLVSILNINMSMDNFEATKDVANNVAVLDVLGSLELETAELDEPVDSNAACLYSCISFAVNGKEIAKGSGNLQGEIKDPTLDTNACAESILSEFGYNPIFFVTEKNEFLGNIHPRVRAQFDHRAQALTNAFADLLYTIAHN